MRPVVGGVDDDRVLGDPERVQLVQQRTDDLVVVDHRVVVGRLPAPRLPDALRLGMRAPMHVGRVEPDEERRPRLVLAVDEVEPMLQHLVVDRLHPLLRQWPRVLNALPAHAAPARLLGRVVLVRRPAVQDTARAEPLPEVREVGRRRVVRRLGVLLRVQVVEVAEELVEAVHRRQELVAVAEVVLAELAGGVAERLQQLGDRRILRLQPYRGAGHADLGQTGANRILSGRQTGG